MSYVRERIARSVNARVATALQEAVDADLQREAQLRAEIADIANDVRKMRFELDSREAMMRELDERMRTAIATTQASVGEVSSQLIDTQRRQSEILERLVRRLQAVEQATGSTIRTNPPA